MLNSYYLMIEEKENEIRKGKKEIGDQKKKNDSKQPSKGKKEKEEQQMQQTSRTDDQQTKDSMTYDRVFIINDFPNYEEYQKMDKYDQYGVYVFNHMKENKKDDIDYGLLDRM